jgi:hypothetical protein
MVVDFNDWRVQRFLEWLCTIAEDREPKTQGALCEELGWVKQRAVDMKNDPDFLAAWEHRYRKTVGSPEKAQLVVTRLFETATDRTDPRQVPAARAWMEAVDAVRPKRVDVTVSKAAKDLSEEELNAILAEEASRELNRRARD